MGVGTNLGRAALVALTILGACGRSPSPPEEPYRLSGRACLRALGSAGITYTPWAAPSGRSCRVDTPVRSRGTARLSFAPPLETSCAVLAAWGDYERALADAARRILRTSIVQVRHFGSYSCRAMTGNGSRMSLHGRARAVDIAGFVTADGRSIVVRRDWHGRGSEGRFLRAAASAACRIFSVVLTPDTDGYHADHLHLDIGPWRQCDA